MSKQLINDTTLTAIADAIRAMDGSSASMYPSEMPAKIRNIPSPYYHYEIPEGRPNLSQFTPHNSTEYGLMLFAYGNNVYNTYSLKPVLNKSSYYSTWYIYGYSSANESFTLLNSMNVASSTTVTDNFPSGLSYDYMLIEIVPQESAAHINGIQVSEVDQYMVARYVKGPNINSFSTTACRALEHDVWENVTYRGSFSSTWSRSRNLQEVEFKNCTITPTTMLQTFQTCLQLKSIKGAESFNTSSCTNMKSTFADCSCLADFDFLKNWDTSNVTTMEQMFMSCGNMTEIDVSNWNVKKVTTFFQMFKGTNRLHAIDLSAWEPNVVTTMEAMFYNDTQLIDVKMPAHECPVLTTLETTFYGCNSIQHMDLTDFDTPALTTLHQTWYQNYRVQKLDMSDMDLTNVTNTSNGDFGIQTSTCRTIIFPDNMPRLGNSAITQNKGLQEIVLPASVTAIGSQAFSQCSNLVSVTLLSTSLVALANVNAFESTSANLKIYVPSDLVASYQGATNWVTLASQIEAIGG